MAVEVSGCGTFTKQLTQVLTLKLSQFVRPFSLLFQFQAQNCHFASQLFPFPPSLSTCGYFAFSSGFDSENAFNLRAHFPPASNTMHSALSLEEQVMTDTGNAVSGADILHILTTQPIENLMFFLEGHSPLPSSESKCQPALPENCTQELARESQSWYLAFQKALSLLHKAEYAEGHSLNKAQSPVCSSLSPIHNNLLLKMKLPVISKMCSVWYF